MSETDTGLYEVSWHISLDAASPESAAHEALRTLHDTFAGDPDSPNVFTVVDTAADIEHHTDLGDEENSSQVAIWPRPDRYRFEPRLNPADARLMAGDDRRVSLRVRIDQDRYLEGHAMFLSGSGGDDHFDYLHAEAFSFGCPHDPTTEIVAVNGADFLVDYSTVLTDEILQADRL